MFIVWLLFCVFCVKYCVCGIINYNKTTVGMAASGSGSDKGSSSSAKRLFYGQKRKQDADDDNGNRSDRHLFDHR